MKTIGEWIDVLNNDAELLPETRKPNKNALRDFWTSNRGSEFRLKCEKYGLNSSSTKQVSKLKAAILIVWDSRNKASGIEL